jgi:hypothetical protein
VRIPSAEVERVLGWHLDASGLCRGDVCIPVRDRAGLADGDDLDLEALAGLLGRPLALDAKARVAALGTALGDRSDALRSLEVPDVEVPDLEGKPRSLRAFQKKKVLLIAWASW